MGEAKYAKTKKPKFKKNLFLFPAECKKKNYMYDRNVYEGFYKNC